MTRDEEIARIFEEKMQKATQDSDFEKVRLLGRVADMLFDTEKELGWHVSALDDEEFVIVAFGSTEDSEEDDD